MCQSAPRHPVHTAEPLVSEPTAFELEMATYLLTYSMEQGPS